MVSRAQLASPQFDAIHYLNTDAVRTIGSLSNEELEGLWVCTEWTPKNFGILVSPIFRRSRGIRIDFLERLPQNF